MAWVDLYQHIVSTSADPDNAGIVAASYMEADAFWVWDGYPAGYEGPIYSDCGYPYWTTWHTPNAESGSSFQLYDGYSYVSQGPAAILTHQPEYNWKECISGYIHANEGPLLVGRRIRVRAHFFGPGYSGSASGASLHAGAIGQPEGYFCQNQISISADNEWYEFELNQFESYDGSIETRGVGVRLSSNWTCDGPPGYLAVEIQIWDEPDLIANDDEAEAASGGPVTIPILANDTMKGEPVTLSDLASLPVIVRQPESGTATINGNGEMVYTPAPGFSGTVTVEYEIYPADQDEPGTIDLCYADRGEGGHMILPSDELNEGGPLAVEDSYGNGALFEYWSGVSEDGRAWGSYNNSVYFEDGGQVFIYQGGEVRVATMHEGVKLFAYWLDGWSEMNVAIASWPWSLPIAFTYNGQRFEVGSDDVTTPNLVDFWTGEDVASVEVEVPTDGGPPNIVCGSLGFPLHPS